MEKTKRKNYNYRQVANSVKVMDEKDKERLIKELKAEKFKKLLSEIRTSAKNLNISFDEITEMVEQVRKERYETKKQGSNRY